MLTLLARLGYAARGVVSLLVGSLALLAALGRGGETTGSHGALGALLRQPLGHWMLGAVALGLACFAMWRLCQGLLDADARGREPKALLARGGQVLAAGIYLGLAAAAISLLLGVRGSGEDGAAQRDWTAWLLGLPLGRWIVAGIGLGVVVAAATMAAQAWTARFRRYLNLDEPTARWVVPLGRAGYAARAVVTLIAGAFLILAAWQSDPSNVRGLGGALEALQDRPFGQGLLAVVAAGLAAFGALEFAEARYRRIEAPRAGALLHAPRQVAG